MSLEFLDNGLPVEHTNGEYEMEEIVKFKNYCNILGKTPSQLTKEELKEYYSEND